MTVSLLSFFRTLSVLYSARTENLHAISSEFISGYQPCGGVFDIDVFKWACIWSWFLWLPNLLCLLFHHSADYWSMCRVPTQCWISSLVLYDVGLGYMSFNTFNYHLCLLYRFGWFFTPILSNKTSRRKPYKLDTNCTYHMFNLFIFNTVSIGDLLFSRLSTFPSIYSLASELISKKSKVKL